MMTHLIYSSVLQLIMPNIPFTFFQLILLNNSAKGFQNLHIYFIPPIDIQTGIEKGFSWGGGREWKTFPLYNHSTVTTIEFHLQS